MSITYEDIKTILSRIDGIVNAPEYQPMPEADEFDINEEDWEDHIIEEPL